MSSGTQHDRFHKHAIFPISFIIGFLFYLFTRDFVYTLEIFMTFYLAQQLNRFCTPDTDIDNKTYQDYLTSIIDPYLSMLWFIFWLPFRKIVPHRHWLSHGIIIGAIVRLLYLFLILSPVIFYYNLQQYMYIYYDFVLIFIGGYIVADCYHIGMDYIG